VTVAQSESSEHLVVVHRIHVALVFASPDAHGIAEEDNSSCPVIVIKE
jgi:hypothetical protein